MIAGRPAFFAYLYTKCLPMLRTVFASCTLLLICLRSPLSLADEPFDATRLEATELATGLVRPMELAVAPDGRVFFIELDGRLKVCNPDSHQIELVGELDVFQEQENGLIGLALDPHFADTQHVFLQYSPLDYPGQNVSRFTLRDGKLDLASEKVLLQFEEQRVECCHHAGSLQFGPDGNLFIGTGDNTHPGGDSQGYAPIDERDGKSPWDAQKSAANTHQLSGKILRIRPLADGTYEIPPGNLFSADGKQGRPEIYVMGCRNPWRLNVDQKTGFVYWGEVGPDAHQPNDRGPRGYDEINQARGPGNFGWPYFIANNQAYADVDFATGKIGRKYDASAPENASPNNTGSRILPPAEEAFIYYPYGASEEFPELGSGGRTACAGPVYHFDPELVSEKKFPAAFDNTLFIFEWTRHWIKAVRLDEDSKIVSIQPFMPQRKMQRPIDIEFGPDGAMYVLEYGETWGVNQDAKLVRIDYVSGNRRPTAIAGVENNVGREPLQVQFSSRGSFDPDASDTLTYEWVLVEKRNEQTIRTPIATNANPILHFNHPGVFTVELCVNDGTTTATASVPVLVGNAPPKLELRQPQAGFFEPGQPIPFDMFVHDFEDGTNDDDLAERMDVDILDSESPLRASVHVRRISGMFSADESDEAGPVGFQLMKGSDCFNCHDVHAKRVGPPLLEISKKYRHDSHAKAKSVQRVVDGSTGVWGKIPMIPHQQHSIEEIDAMVSWVYSLREDAGLQVLRGFVGDITTDADYSGGLELSASYTDLAVGEIPAITTTTALRLRSRHAEAEHANHVQGPQTLASQSASNGQFVGAINHGHFLRFADIATAHVGRVTARVATAGSGGRIEFRQGNVDGPLLARVLVKANDQWEDWWEETVDFEGVPGTHDVFVVFLNEENRNALMNLDSIYFQPAQ